MAVEKVARVLVVVHDQSRERFLKLLQRQRILHIIKTESGEQVAADTEAGRTFGRLAEAIEYLKPREKRKRGLLVSDRPALSQAEFDAAAAGFDPEPELERLNRLHRELSELDSREKAAAAEMKRLRPWSKLHHDPSELCSLDSVTAVPGRFADRGEYERALVALAGSPAMVELVAEENDGVLAVIVFATCEVESVLSIVNTLRFESVDLRSVRGLPATVIAGLERDIAAMAGDRARLEEQVAESTAALVKLRIAADAAAARAGRLVVEAGLAHTASAALVHGWVKRRDLPKLERVVAEVGHAAFAEVEPAPGEEMPVALTNPRLFRPFEMVLELFSLPLPGEVDPTVLLAPFFAVSFALCLTDAGYGIVASVVTYLLLRKLGASNKLLGIILWGSLVTIPAGALVGGWFGDIPDRLGIPWLLNFKNAVMWFDPVKDPMKFFVLSLAFGYVHMMYGMVIEIGDCIRVRDFAGALLGQAPWFVSFNALLVLVLAGKVLPEWARAALLVAILLSVAAVIVFTQRSAETMPAQWLWFGFIGLGLVFLSARLRWLPPALLAAKWALLGFVALMMVLTVVDLLRARRLKPVAAGLGLLAVAGLGLYFARVIPGALAVLAAVAFFLASPRMRAVLPKLGWGGYALYGATGYIGVVLSYIRLMALGMVTGGIAVTVNVIAWMVLPIPVLGVVLAIIIMVFGHAYNIAVNILGAFVHSLRLNYVEFFPRFYTGGSEPFVAFREEHQYTLVK